MWSQEIREAYAQRMAFFESKLIELFNIVAEFISTYRLYILIGVIILVFLALLDWWFKWQDRKEKIKINDQIEEQMKEKMTDEDLDRYK
jgi:Tfp pilus assembly protein PilO